MDEICIKVIIYDSNNEQEKLKFNFKRILTFENLIDYISSFCITKICPCYNFYYSNIEINKKMKIENEFSRSKKAELSLKLDKCNCNDFFKYFNYSKIHILELFKKIHEDDEATNKSLQEELTKKFKEISDYKNLLDKSNKKIEKLEKDNQILKYSVKGDFVTINKLKKIGFDLDLKPKNIINIDQETNQFLGNNNNNFNNNNFNNNNIDNNNIDNININKNNNIDNKNVKIIFEDFYDVIIDIKSIKEINKGWEIKMNERGKKNYELYKEKEILKIGVLGNANKGKSYLLSRISKIDLPSGTSIRTEGLSIKYPELEKFKHRKIALLDSAGFETPVLREDNEKYEISSELFKEKSREKLITEIFLQNYIIHNSDILILVVGILTYSEQKLLNRIKTEIKKEKINKPLYIIHNLSTYTGMKEIEDYINKYLLNSATFILEEGHKSSTEITNEDEDEDNGIYFYEKNSNPKIFHLIFANDNSIAGTYYNSFSIKFLENSFQQQVTDIDKFDVIKSVKERFIEKSKEIIELKDKEIKQIKLDDFEEQNNLIKLKNEQNITLKKCLIDELGFSNLKGNGFEPNYNYYKKDDNIIIRLEGPGNCNLIPSIDYAGEYTIIRLQGTKKKDKEPEKLEDNIHNTREFGDYTLEIPLKTEDFIIINEKPIIEEKLGVIEIKYKLDIKKEPQPIFNPEVEI